MDDPEITGPEEGRPALPPAAHYVRPPKSPGLALVLSVLFPGIGQVYNGQLAKALVFFFALVASLYATIEINPLPFSLFIPFLYFFNMVDAYRSAALVNARHAGRGDVPEEDTAESPAWGLTLVLIGLVLLANNLHWIDLARLQQLWPAILIVAGAVLLWGSIQKRKETGSGRSF